MLFRSIGNDYGDNLGTNLLIFIITYGMNYDNLVLSECNSLVYALNEANNEAQLSNIMNSSTRKWELSSSDEVKAMAENYQLALETIESKTTTNALYREFAGLYFLIEKIYKNWTRRVNAVWVLKNERESASRSSAFALLMKFIRRRARKSGVSIITADTPQDFHAFTCLKFTHNGLDGCFRNRETRCINHKFDTNYNEAYRAELFRIPFVSHYDIEAEELINLWLHNVFIPSLARPQYKFRLFKIERTHDFDMPVKDYLPLNFFLDSLHMIAAFERRLSLVPDCDFKSTLLEIVKAEKLSIKIKMEKQ